MTEFFQKLLSKNLYVYVFFFCVTIIVYAGVLNGPFFFDDNIFIEHNVSVRSFDIAKIYSSSTTAGSGLSGDNFYRPNAQILYALLFFLFGLWPFIFHLVLIILHVSVGFLIFLLFCDLGIRREYSFIGCLLFLLNPIQTEAVSYISGFSEPLMLISMIGILILFARGLSEKDGFNWKKILAIILLTVIGFFSKENAIILSGLILIVWLYLYKRGQILNQRKALWIWTVVAALSLIYLSLRFTVFNFTSGMTGGFGISTFSNSYTESILIRLITFVSILYQYVSLILFPVGLHYEKPYLAYDTLLSLSGIFGLIIILGGVYLSYRSIKYGKGVFFLAYSWFFVSILPVSGIIPTNAMYLEHWLYIPIIGIIFAVTYLLSLYERSHEGRQENNLFIFVTIIILFIYGIMTFVRSQDWADPIRFYKNELRYTTNSARIYNNLAMEMANRGKCGVAMPYYYEAISINDSYPQTHHNLGRCLEDMGKTKEAILEYQKALIIDPAFYYSSDRLKILLNKHD